MKYRFAVLFLLSLSILTVFAQQPQPKIRYLFSYFLRAETGTQSTISNSMSANCLLVLANGDFRIEKSYQEPGIKPDIKVYEGHFTETELQQLHALVDTPEFRAVRSPERDGTTYVDEYNILGVSVNRSETEMPQVFHFWEQQERKKFTAALKPFENWLKDQFKRKLMQNKDAKGNQCKPPRPNLPSGMEPPPSNE